MTKLQGRSPITTRKGVVRLESERPTLNPNVAYTIGGSIEATVHSCVNAEREGQIRQGWKALERASRDLGRDQPAARLPGYAKAEFKERANGKASYLRQQKKAAAAAVLRPRSPSQST